MYLAGFILGGMIAIYLLSKLAGVLAFRKVPPPKRQVFSVGVAFIVATVIAGFALADEGQTAFGRAALLYGIASILVLGIQLLVFYKNRENA